MKSFRSKVKVHKGHAGRSSGLDATFGSRRLASTKKGLYFRSVPTAAPRYMGKDAQRIHQAGDVTKIHLATAATVAQPEWTKRFPRLEPVLDTRPEAIALAAAAVLLVAAPLIFHLSWSLNWGGMVLALLLAIVAGTSFNLFRKERAEKELRRLKELIAARDFQKLTASFEEIATHRDSKYRDFVMTGVYGEVLGQALSDMDLDDDEVRLIAQIRPLVNEDERRWMNKFFLSDILADATRDENLDDKEEALLKEFVGTVDFNPVEVAEMLQLITYHQELRRQSKTPLEVVPAPAPLTGVCHLALQGRLLRYEPTKDYLMGGQRHVEQSYVVVSEGKLIVRPTEILYLVPNGAEVRIDLTTVEAAILLPADDAFELHLIGREEPVFFTTPENAKTVMVIEKAVQAL